MKLFQALGDDSQTSGNPGNVLKMLVPEKEILFSISLILYLYEMMAVP